MKMAITNQKTAIMNQKAWNKRTRTAMTTMKSIENESPDEKMECHMIFYAKKNGFF